ncbi:pyrimidine 5'-nucleotidase [Otariodibacter oris]|uniref:Putative hydrolase of the HAD superfamily n=1 Tax=Otariodibacter oris TaxID=1032623 RepID=A0A420XIM2_9PAST|nr:pyrimidine 5'-nucleotidase [Otariodibacter oris]QGM80749.1 noncanonical pyrimidine nucleotidase, YjjG family [Otariodibacter oris]RKR77086.1 putative hydrolase of the HAD superfamily [Otariodibacter oris]
MKYQWILFDADETLFSFNSFLGLKSMLLKYNIDFTPEDYAEFQAINKPLWVAYQNNEIEAKDIQRIRFEKLSKQTGIEPLILNSQLMEEMALLSHPLDGVKSTLDKLYGRVKMGIITNGFNALQQKRLMNTKMDKYFDLVVVSEMVGEAKPSPKIFEFAFSQMGDVEKERVLMVGDTLASDVQGGINVGIDTCWFNHAEENNNTAIIPTHEIKLFSDLIKIISG